MFAQTSGNTLLTDTSFIHQTLFLVHLLANAVHRQTRYQTAKTTTLSDLNNIKRRENELKDINKDKHLTNLTKNTIQIIIYHGVIIRENAYNKKVIWAQVSRDSLWTL